MLTENVRLVDVESEDLSLIERWLHADHVRRYWGDPAKNLHNMKHPPDHGYWRAIIEAEGRKVGLVIWQHPSRRELDEAGLFDIPETIIDIDIMIGEIEDVGHGFGPSAIHLVVARVSDDPSVPFITAGTSTGNKASRRAFEKAGFIIDRTFDDTESPTGQSILLCYRGRSE